MNCAVVVDPSSNLSSPLPFAAKSATLPVPATSASVHLPSHLFARLHGPRCRSTLVAVSRRDHCPYSPDSDNDPPSISSSFPPSGGRMVDEGMLVLRKRIQDAEMAEMNYDPPREWADWERAYYTRYGSDMCAALGILQSFLLATRPAVALGAAAMIALSLPVSAGAVVFAVLQIARAVGAVIGI